MPKQVIHWGKEYLLVHHPETENTSEYWTQEPFKGVTMALSPKGQIEIWQNFLNKERGEKLNVDGIHGKETDDAIKRYQEFLGVKADGTWGKDTEGAHLAVLDKRQKLTREPNLEVVWVRPEDRSPVPLGEDQEGHVQIGIDLDAVDMQDRIRYSDGVVAHTFYTDRLTRAQINELIRVLKRARNAAFGSDE